MEKSGLTPADRVQFDLSKELALFNGNSAHSVEPFQGDRYSIVWFSLGCHEKASAEDRAKLQQLGIPCPAPNENPYALLRRPNGTRAQKRAVSTAAVNKSLKPYRSFTKAMVEKRRTLPAAAIKKAAAEFTKRRLKPENARSFYGHESRREKFLARKAKNDAEQ